MVGLALQHLMVSGLTITNETWGLVLDMEDMVVMEDTEMSHFHALLQGLQLLDFRTIIQYVMDMQFQVFRTMVVHWVSI